MSAIINESKINGKRGLSSVVATVLLIALTIVLVAVAWGIINNFVNKETGSASACFGVFEDVNLNKKFTCYNESSGEFHFSIDVREVELEGILVGISVEGSSVNFELEEEESQIGNLKTFGGSQNVASPVKNSGQTYIYDLSAAGFGEAPDSIQIAPIVDGVQCGVSDSMSQFISCASLA